MTLPALALLLSAYLHQDWTDDYASVWDGVEAFVEGEGPDAASRLADDTREVLASGRSEPELRDLVIDELAAGYYPPGDDLTFGEWLRQLGEHLG